jgi:hypothetical protein
MGSCPCHVRHVESRWCSAHPTLDPGDEERRKEGKSAGEYMQKINALTNAMVAVGAPLRDDEIIHYMLNGLGSASSHIAASMKFVGIPVTLAEFYSHVLKYEMHFRSTKRSSRIGHPQPTSCRGLSTTLIPAASTTWVALVAVVLRVLTTHT